MLYVTIYVHNVNIYLFQSTDDNANPRIPSSRSRGTDEPHIGKYRLIKTIGKGNFAKVKLAKHVPTGREVRKTEQSRIISSRRVVCSLVCYLVIVVSVL